jgi:ATP-dependent exoDNAse (exonuclease V) beta subunit
LNTETNFKIYNASAGSGKTYTLVKEYLKKIVASSSVSGYKNLLAITFTNKAVAEMKQRIVSALITFSEEKAVENPNDMMLAIAEETETPIASIQKKAKNILKHLLHHYASFSVETIDRFNHQLIRTFSRDLQLSSNFDVTLDTNQLLIEAVEELIGKAGESTVVTQVLLDFVLEKIDDDRSWDISRDITKAASILYKENELQALEALKKKKLSDFITLKKELQEKKKQLEVRLVQVANDALTLIAESGLEHSDFSGAYFPKYLLKISSLNINVGFGTAWQESIGEKSMYPGRVLKETPDIAEIIDELTPRFKEQFLETKELIQQILLHENSIKNLTPLSVINLVKNEIETIKEEQNILPISEFNTLINREIKNQPAPFIYERLGERYRHYFIDEFQDTSLYQWENLKPLIENALTQQFENEEQGSLLLVGDTKQSIYRWRGGLPEQFLDLCTSVNPFPILKKVENLPKNYRSCKEVVDFNNNFFTHISQLLANEAHQNLYLLGSKQQLEKDNGGYVNISFLSFDDTSQKHDVYGERVLKTISKLKNSSFNYKDICILTRRKKDGIALSEFLMEQNIPVVSQETLLLDSSEKIRCIIAFLQLLENTSSNTNKVSIASFLFKHLNIKLDKHTFITSFLDTSLFGFSENLATYNINLDFIQLASLSTYEACEQIIEKLRFNKDADAYIFGFMDFVFEYEQQPNKKSHFLEYWEAKKDSAAIATSTSIDAVQLMTIHKSKGLEFPVVIFPYADVNIYEEKDAKIWYPLESPIAEFNQVRINFKKEVAEYNQIGKELYEGRRKVLELDNYNLLYVALTRAVEQLYIFSEKAKPLKTEVLKDYNNLFHSFLLQQKKWEDGKNEYEFGVFQKKMEENVTNKIKQIIPNYNVSLPDSHQLHYTTSKGSLWGTEASKAIELGNSIHDIMALIVSYEDVDDAFKKYSENDNLSDSVKQSISTIINHPELKHLFDYGVKVAIEKDILTTNGIILRPDRINFHEENKVTIVDYKTGAPNEKNNQQINEYGSVLEQMGFNVLQKKLVYISEGEILINNL